MRVMVTGGAGFIGSAIVRELLQKDYQVSVLDNLSTGNRENIANGVNFYYGDIRDRNFVFDTLLMEQPEIIFHLAAQVSVPISVENPYFDAESNINGTVNILDAAVKSNIRKIIFASSAAVYGVPEYLPIDENHSIKPLSGYAVSKYTGEQYFTIYKEIFGLNYTVLRFANVYGPGQLLGSEGGVVAIFIKKMLNNSNTVIYGDGKQTRDFIYVKDVVAASLACIDKAGGMTINIGTQSASSVKGLFDILSEILENNSKPSYEKERNQDIRHSFLKINKAIKCLGWEPEYSLKDGIKDTLKILKASS
ncbi:MAG: NAD-dependent epimerase/dehydratase family protein [Eubacteriales bacterium]